MNDEIREILIFIENKIYPKDSLLFEKWSFLKDYITNLQQENEDYKSRLDKAVEQAKEKIKRYESYINDLKKGNYPSPTIRQERQELIFKIKEQENLLNILQNGSDASVKD